MNRFTVWPTWCLAVTLAMSVGLASAADSGGGSDALAGPREHIAAKKWAAALESLREVDDRGNPDWQNLTGYVLRQQAKPDLAGAQKHYDAALRIDPAHRGALEYSGQLALMKGDLAVAEQRLARLEQVCRKQCEEYRDLLASIRTYKSTGKPDAGHRW